jgi:hypothetical protein
VARDAESSLQCSRWKRNGVTQRLGRGINLGNALDVARDETPRLMLEERHLVAVKAAGFDFIRLPVCWSAHAKRSAPYTIDGALFERVDRVIEEAIRLNLTVILDVHHYRELQRNPSRHTARFLALPGHPPTRPRSRPSWSPGLLATGSRSQRDGRSRSSASATTTPASCRSWSLEPWPNGGLASSSLLRSPRHDYRSVLRSPR